VPTTRARHLLTETDDLAAAIDAAAERYPGETRAGVLRHLALAGAEALTQQQQRHRDVVHAHAAGFPGLYGPGYLDDLRDEWPS
jgi:hypothetical protein